MQTVSSKKLSETVEVFSFIGKKNLLINCYDSYAGVSRSAACVISYLMAEHGMSMFSAM